MIYIKDKRSIDKMRKAGQLLAGIMAEISDVLKEDMTTLELDTFITKRMRSVGLKPECIGYKGYKHATCISVNDTVVHGVPSDDVVIKKGDLVKVDVVGSYKNYCVDMARCFFVGEPTARAKKVAMVAEVALNKALDVVRVGNKVNDISVCIENEVRSKGLGVIRDFAGHGIGKSMHEAPEIPNFDIGEDGATLRAGMTLAIEPMVTEKDHAVYVDKDGWTVKTVDGGLAGHVEDTVLVTEDGPEVLTRLGGGLA